MIKSVLRLLTAALCSSMCFIYIQGTVHAAGNWNWDTEGHYDTSWYTRSGRTFTLTTAEELAGLAYIVNQGDNLKLPGESSALRETFTGKTILLGADISLNERAYSGRDDRAHQWPSIGGGIHTEDNAVFNGRFDGQGFTIRNLYIHDLTVWTEYAARNRGLFGITAENAVIENLYLRDGYIRSARSTGGIVGKTGYLNDSEDANSITGYDASLSGHGSIIRNCHNVNTTVITTDSKGVGGIVGACWNFALIQNCSNSGKISSIGNYPAGGIAGENEYIIENCYNTGEISSAGSNAGGIVGSNKLATSEIRGCYNTGKINGKFAGGIAGWHVGPASGSYNVGAVTGTNAGALFGELKSGLKNERLYYLSGGAGAIGLKALGGADTKAVSASDMKGLSAALGGMFKADSSNMNNGYPVLSWQGRTFSDVADDAWYKDSAAFVMDKGLFDSVGVGKFGPDTPSTRGMLVTALYRLSGSPGSQSVAGFVDVFDGTELGEAVSWAVELGIASGAGSKAFEPDSAVTREQLAAMLYRYAKQAGKNTSSSGSLSAFSDEGEVSGWGKEALSWAVGAKLISGSEGAINPKGTASRAQTAQILQSFV